MQKQLNKLYRQTQMNSAPSGRQIEISILELASSKLRSQLPTSGELSWSHDLNDAMKFNQKVWDVFSADWMNPESSLSIELRQNLLSIAIFVKKKTFALQANPKLDGLQLLVSLNGNIIDGLSAPRTKASEV
jgi:flagellar protein FlaF